MVRAFRLKIFSNTSWTPPSRRESPQTEVEQHFIIRVWPFLGVLARPEHISKGCEKGICVSWLKHSLHTHNKQANIQAALRA